MDAKDVVGIGHGDEIPGLGAEVGRAYANSQQGPTTDFIESIAPGWRAHGEELSARIDESNEKAASEADEDERRDLEAPVRPDVLEEWTRLSGRVPDPA